MRRACILLNQDTMLKRQLLIAALVALTGTGCGITKPTRPFQPLGWDEGIRVNEAVDMNPAPNVVEVALTATVTPMEIQPGLTTPMWTYNGSLPGPLIKAKVGDRVIVHFKNDLSEPTTVHWHGVRLPANMDGTPVHSQPPVLPGATFDYSFVVPDASLFWYHPHVNAAVQVGDGLYGPLLVEDPADEVAREGRDGEPPALGDPVVLVLSDVNIQPDGSFSEPDAGGNIATLFGREGNNILVNGRVKPTLLARRGLRQRWRIVNTAKSRYFQLMAAGHAFTRIGGDGGLIPSPIQSDRVLIIPGGRADVVVTPDGPPGTIVPVRWVATDRGWGTAYNRPDEDIFYLRITDDDAVEAPPVPSTLRTIAALDLSGATPRDIELTQQGTDDAGKLVLGINGVPASEATPLHAVLGETDVWTITNNMYWDHPFHLHGFFFQELDSVTGDPLPALEWRDTFNVPAMHTAKMAVRYDDRAGMWMFHCHILDHADAGMMGMLMLH